MLRVNVRKVRKKKNISQTELVKKTGLSQSYISELETNSMVKNPTLKIINQIAEVLEVCPLELLECDCEHCRGK